jgi:hypothetical protein
MPGIAAAVEMRRGLQHRCAGPSRADRCAQRGIAAADHQYIITLFGIEWRHRASAGC